jgi:hypothetical protein
MESVTPRMQRLLATSGLVFVALIAASIFVVPNPPNSHASAAKVVTFFQAHKTATGVAGHLILLGVFVGVFFFWYFRDLIATTPTSRHLATIGFAGAIIFAVTGGVAAGAFYTLMDTVGHADPSTIQTLNLIQTDLTNGIGEAGVALFLVASSAAIIRGRRLPQWLAWVGILLGVASVLIFGIGLPAMGLWLLITCLTMLVRTNAPATVTTPGQEPALG